MDAEEGSLQPGRDYSDNVGRKSSQGEFNA